MSAEAVKRLETVRKIIQAGHDTDHSYPSPYTDGMKFGLRLALEHIEREIRWTKDLDAALAEAQPQ